MNVLITLTSAGTDLGPFDLYSDTDGYITAFESGISRTQLLAGYTSTVVPDGTTIIRAQSTGDCTNSIDIPVEVTTTTTTTTLVQGTLVYMSVGFPIGAVCGQSNTIPRYHDGIGALPTNGDKCFTDSDMLNPIVGSLDYYKIDNAYVQLDATGEVVSKGVCYDYTEFPLSSGTTFGAVCDETVLDPKWHDGLLPDPIVGDTVYVDQIGNVLVGNLQYFKLTTAEYIRIDDSGVITDKQSCI